MKKLVALCLVLVLVVAMVACGGGGKNPAVGTWKLTGLFEGEEDYSAYLAMLGMDLTIVLNEDGTGTMEMMGEKLDITWADGKIMNEGESLSFSVDGDTLTISEEGERMVFTRQ
jgi:hypothetical protein